MRRASAEPAARILDELGRLIRHLSRISGGDDDSPAMTGTQRLALFEVAEDGPLRLSDVAQRIGVSAPTASRAVDALDELQLVERLPDPDDRRALRIDLTAAGRASVTARKRRVRDTFAPAADALSADEQEQLVELLARLSSALADHVHSVPSGRHSSGASRE